MTTPTEPLTLIDLMPQTSDRIAGGVPLQPGVYVVKVTENNTGVFAVPAKTVTIDGELLHADDNSDAHVLSPYNLQYMLGHIFNAYGREHPETTVGEIDKAIAWYLAKQQSKETTDAETNTPTTA